MISILALVALQTFFRDQAGDYLTSQEERASTSFSQLMATFAVVMLLLNQNKRSDLAAEWDT